LRVVFFVESEQRLVHLVRAAAALRIRPRLALLQEAAGRDEALLLDALGDETGGFRAPK